MYNKNFSNKSVKTISSVTLGLSLTLANSLAYGKEKALEIKTPHIFGFVQSPPTRAKNVTHSFHLQIPQNSNSLSQLTINFPYGLRASKNISVFDDSKRKIDTNVVIEEDKVTLLFPQPVTPGNTLEVKMKDISIVAFPRTWLYSVDARFVGLNSDIPVGLFQIRAYR